MSVSGFRTTSYEPAAPVELTEDERGRKRPETAFRGIVAQQRDGDCQRRCLLDFIGGEEMADASAPFRDQRAESFLDLDEGFFIVRFSVRNGELI